MSEQVEQLLQSVFGFSSFLPLQGEIIANLLERRDTLAVMPTGGGKSLCYQLPALIFPGLTVVVSPLIALMKDQVEQLDQLGIPAIFLNSSLSLEAYADNMDRLRRGEVRLLYISPESLLNTRMLAFLGSLQVDCLTIDEAHCISQWGHDFRPEYRQLAEARQRFASAVCLALTATATPRVRQDIKAVLRFDDANEFIGSFNRPNLFLEVRPKQEATAQTVDFLRGFPEQSGIIYCFSRQQVDDLAFALASRGFSVRPYHAGLSDQERQQNQEDFIRDEVQIIVATIAFGLGINKSNLRFVMHYDLPKSLESYYQEVGRSGRDGLPAHCLLLYSYADTNKVRYFIDQQEEPLRSNSYQHLQALVDFAETFECRRAPILAHFGERYEQKNCGMCDNCRSSEQPELVDITVPAQKFLSCVKRTGERFGAGYVADVLLGSQAEKVLRNRHNELSTYNIGRELKRRDWMRLARQLVQLGLLERYGEYQVLRLTPQAYEALKSQEPIRAALLLEQRQMEAAELPPAERPRYDPQLFELLRKKRKALADQAHVPPYVILSDRSLVEMASYYPMSLSSLERIHGIGAVKLARYGATLIEIIQGYCNEKGLGERHKPGTSNEKRGEQPDKRPRYQVVGEAYNAGASVQSLMREYSVQQRTILNHLARYAMDGQPLRDGDDLPASELPAEMQARTLGAFAELGAAFLRPVFDALGGAVSFDDLHILRLHYLCKRKT
ncbi:MAG: DNA helicase RecQ [Chloroflexota bacterium]